jgi:hypothetical protein
VLARLTNDWGLPLDRLAIRVESKQVTATGEAGCQKMLLAESFGAQPAGCGNLSIKKKNKNKQETKIIEAREKGTEF